MRHTCTFEPADLRRSSTYETQPSMGVCLLVSKLNAVVR